MPRQKQERTAEQETTVPLTEERSDVSKREFAIEATITKKACYRDKDC